MTAEQITDLRNQLETVQNIIGNYLRERLMPDWGYLSHITPSEASLIDRCIETLMQFSAMQRHDRKPDDQHDDQHGRAEQQQK